MWRSRPPKETMVQIAALLERATRLNPEHAWSQDSLARALAETDPGERAVAAARKAVSLEPSVAAHHLALVQALWTASQEADARGSSRPRAPWPATIASASPSRNGSISWIAHGLAEDG